MRATRQLDCPNLFIIPNKLWIKLDPTGESIQTGTSLLEYASPIFFLLFDISSIEGVGFFFSLRCVKQTAIVLIREKV
jgi:hypothetical protein